MEEHKSLWAQSVQLPRRERLEGDLRADVAVIGAGMAGLLIAHRLGQRGVRAVVLEADRVAGGQTQNTTAKLTSQHGMLYDALIKRFGEEKAAQYARANEQAIHEYAALVDEHKIACDFREAPAYLYSVVAPEPMRVEAEAARGSASTQASRRKRSCPSPLQVRCALSGRRSFTRSNSSRRSALGWTSTRIRACFP